MSINVPSMLAYDKDTDNVLVLQTFPELQSAENVHFTVSYIVAERVWSKLGWRVLVSDTTPEHGDELARAKGGAL